MPDLLIVDDDLFTLDGLRAFFEAKGFDNACASDMTAAREHIRSRTFDAAVLDVLLPEAASTPRYDLNPIGGIQLARELKSRHPRAGVVLFSAYEDRALDFLAICQAGLRGVAYVLKGVSSARLVSAVYDTMQGMTLLDASEVEKKSLGWQFNLALSDDERPHVLHSVERLPNLSEQEWKVVERIASCHSVAEVAEHLNISPKTVYTHLQHAYEKLGLDRAPATLDRQLLLAKALWLHQLGWQPPQQR